MKILSRSFYERNTEQVAQDLLGKLLVCQTSAGEISGRIVETEAYFGLGDPASHASKGRTPRSEIMFGRPGIAYVYLNYGMHYLLNIVTEKENVPGAVLLRALEPVKGIALMFKSRPVKFERELTNGPGKLTQALGIDGTFNGQDITRGNLRVVDNGRKKDFVVVKATRIGISFAEDRPLRYYVRNSPFVSKS